VWSSQVVPPRWFLPCGSSHGGPSHRTGPAYITCTACFHMALRSVTGMLTGNDVEQHSRLRGVGRCSARRHNRILWILSHCAHEPALVLTHDRTSDYKS
jgi:hypothetical protein